MLISANHMLSSPTTSLNANVVAAAVSGSSDNRNGRTSRRATALAKVDVAPGLPSPPPRRRQQGHGRLRSTHRRRGAAPVAAASDRSCRYRPDFAPVQLRLFLHGHFALRVLVGGKFLGAGHVAVAAQEKSRQVHIRLFA